MKTKIMLISIILILLSVCISSQSIAKTKYDCILTNPNFQKIISKTNEVLSNDPELAEYLNELINLKDLANLQLSKEKMTFIQENKHKFLTYLHCIIVGVHLSKIEPTPKPSEILYVTSVIRSHKRGKSIAGAKTEMDAMIEKKLFEEHVLYKVWINMRKPGAIEKGCNDALNHLYENSKRK